MDKQKSFKEIIIDTIPKALTPDVLFNVFNNMTTQDRDAIYSLIALRERYVVEGAEPLLIEFKKLPDDSRKTLAKMFADYLSKAMADSPSAMSYISEAVAKRINAKDLAKSIAHSPSAMSYIYDELIKKFNKSGLKY